MSTLSPPPSAGGSSKKIMSGKLMKGMVKIFNKNRPTRTNSNGSEEEDPNELQTLKNIDQRPLSESDALMVDLDAFVVRAKTAIDFTRKTSSTKHAKFNPLAMGDKINQWRAKRKGNELHDLFTGLISRTEAAESGLKSLTDQSLSDSSALILQAVQLKIRLNACITHNVEGMDRHRPFMQALEQLLEDMQNRRADVAEMLDFLDEVNLLKESTESPFIPWALRNTDGRDITIIPFKREVLEKRLAKIEKALAKIDKLWLGCQPVFDKMVRDHQHCSQCLAALDHLMAKIESHAAFMAEIEGDAVERENPIKAAANGQNQNGSESIKADSDRRASRQLPTEILAQAAREPFNHAHCSDCSLTCEMANDCAMNLAAAQHLASESTSRLQKLFQIREKMREKAVELDSLDWGEGVSAK